MIGAALKDEWIGRQIGCLPPPGTLRRRTQDLFATSERFDRGDGSMQLLFGC
jgi:hypothetical protein